MHTIIIWLAHFDHNCIFFVLALTFLSVAVDHWSSAHILGSVCFPRRVAINNFSALSVPLGPRVISTILMVFVERLRLAFVHLNFSKLHAFDLSNHAHDAQRPLFVYPTVFCYSVLGAEQLWGFIPDGYFVLDRNLSL
jgi:hypothetical protein